ncbi:hypothetical protein EB796_019800 [Bugula neritina]|uniref:Uncharacterized protein n=1 Tax=Bugula neritina TaxID=10212 RepID=A0A7J7J6Y4_BUGNE|nr:hypothetical protein EB796_019800 [Bugula neritina]
MKVIFLTLVLLCNSSCVSADYLSAMQSLSGELGVMLSPEIHSVELEAAHGRISRRETSRLYATHLLPDLLMQLLTIRGVL